MTTSAVQEVTCPYCKNKANLVSGKDFYPSRPDLADIWIWSCRPCNAKVGCHRKTTIPLGTLAKPHLRRLRQAAHEAFDLMWKTRRWAKRPGKRKSLRRDAYNWLSQKMGIPYKDTHIGLFTEEQCKEVIRICQEYRNGGEDAAI